MKRNSAIFLLTCGIYRFMLRYLVYYSKRQNKFLLPVPAKAIYGSFCRTENEIFNVVNYNNHYSQKGPLTLYGNTVYR